MGVYRSFVQPTTQFPNSSTVTDAVLGTTASLIVNVRPTNNRRGLAIENDGTVPMIFSYGSSVSVSARSIRLEVGDYFEDTFGWQGAMSAMSIGGPGAVNITEMVII